jgi:O-antigen ligase
MACVVLSEQKPLEALESVLRRCTYVLIPLSLVFTKYFPEYGVQYARWTGIRMGTGVTTHKNSLGILCAVMALFLIWALFRQWGSGELLKNKYHSFADAFVLWIALLMLFGGVGTYSATSILVFAISIALLTILFYIKNLARYITNNLKVVIVISVILFMLLNSVLLPIVTSLLGRDASLTDRDVIWLAILGVASENPGDW